MFLTVHIFDLDVGQPFAFTRPGRLLPDYNFRNYGEKQNFVFRIIFEINMKSIVSRDIILHFKSY